MVALINNLLLRPRSFRWVAAAMVVCSVLTLAALTIYVNFAKMRFMSLDYVNWRHQKEFLTSEPAENNDFVILGDSRAMAAYDPLVVSDWASRNLSVGGGTPIESYYTLKRYLQRHTTNHAVMMISPYHLGTADVFWVRTMLFFFLTLDELQEVLRLDQKTGRPYIGRGVAFPILQYYMNFTPFAYRAELRNSAREDRYSANQKAYARNKRHKGQQFYGEDERADGPSRETKQDIVEVRELFNVYLQKTAELASANNVKLYWYTAPINTPSCRALSKSHRDSYQAFLNDIESRLGFAVLNGINCLDPENFGDRNHVNHRGSAVVSRDLADRWWRASGAKPADKTPGS